MKGTLDFFPFKTLGLDRVYPALLQGEGPIALFNSDRYIQSFLDLVLRNHQNPYITEKSTNTALHLVAGSIEKSLDQKEFIKGIGVKRINGVA